MALCAKSGCTLPIGFKDTTRQGDFVAVRVGCANGHDQFVFAPAPDTPEERPMYKPGREPRCGACGGPTSSTMPVCTACRRARQEARRGRKRLGAKLPTS